MRMTKDVAAVFAEVYNTIFQVSARGNDVKRIVRAMALLETLQGAEVIDESDTPAGDTDDCSPCKDGD